MSNQFRFHWRSILAAAGADPATLTNKHQPCPFCGGRDRYRFDDKNGYGTYYCSQCGPGDGFAFLMQLRGCGLPEARAEAERHMSKLTDADLKNSIPHLRKPVKKPRPLPQTMIDRVMEGTQQISPGDVAYRYLRNRGLRRIPTSLYTHKALYDPDTRTHYPGMVAEVVDAEGRIVSLHRTFLTSDGHKASIAAPKRLMTPTTTVKGAAIRLWRPGPTLAVAEGIETAIAVAERFGVPAWATISAYGMERLVLVPGISHVLVCGDHDESYTGQKAAYTLAHRLVQAGLKATVYIPPQPGDWLDMLNGKEALCIAGT